MMNLNACTIGGSFMDASYFIPNETDEFLISQYRDFLPK